MTLEEIKIKKSEIEERMRIDLFKFQLETGLTVESISIEIYNPVIGDDFAGAVKLNVRLPL